MKEVNNQFGLKVAILSLSFLLMMRVTISPALAEIGKAFPAISQETLMMMVVLPSLVAIVFGFLAGAVSGIFKVKQIIYVGLVLFLIGGIGPMFVNDFKVLMVLRALLGAGTGLFIPFAAGLIAYNFKGRERNQMLGFQSAAAGVGNIITSLMAGLLAAIAWNLSFLIYLFAIVTFFLVVFKIPEPVKKTTTEGHGKTVSINGAVSFVCIAILLYSVVYFAFFGYLSFVIDSHALGDSKATGVATMLMTLLALIAGGTFGKVVHKIGRYALLLSLFANALGFILLAVATSLPIIFAGSVFIGFGFGMLMPYSTMLVNEAADESSIHFANGLFMTAVNVGTAISPKILVTIGTLFKNSDGQFIFLVCGVCMAVVTLGYLIYIPFFARKNTVAIQAATR